MKVYLLEHLMIYSDYEDTKFIGVFSTRKLAIDAISELANKPGFKLAPQIVDPLVDEHTSGFIIDECSVDLWSWKEGFGESI